MKLYLSGPMSDKPAFNIPMFDKYASVLRSLGHEVVSPAELDDPEFRRLCLLSLDGDITALGQECERKDLKRETWGDLLARDVKLLADDGIEGIVVLDGWEKSRGALLETYVGRLCGLPIYLPPLLRSGALRPVHSAELTDAHAKAGGWINGLNTLSIPIPGHWEPRTQRQRERERDGGYTDAQTGKWHSEVRITSETGGQKDVKDEVEGDICPKALRMVSKVCGFGRIKYDRLNYLKGYDWSSSYDAMQRHLKAFWAGEEINEESGYHHLAHGAWHALALLAFVLRKVGTDDRP